MTIATKPITNYVLYRRVSTAEQGKSGLGLEAQSLDIENYLTNHSKQPYEVLRDFVEVVSGNATYLPIRDQALAYAKQHKAILLVSRLDRLSRKMSFIAALTDDLKVKFLVATMPEATTLILHIYASIAQSERLAISERTKGALAAAKARGVKLGGLRLQTGQRNAVQAANAQARAKQLELIVTPLRLQGKSLRDIGLALSLAGVRPARGGDSWSPMAVSRVLGRLAVA
jgi:DNA invertase Pin-like site-specific DNA recombinase